MLHYILTYPVVFFNPFLDKNMVLAQKGYEIISCFRMYCKNMYVPIPHHATSQHPLRIETTAKKMNVPQVATQASTRLSLLHDQHRAIADFYKKSIIGAHNFIYCPPLEVSACINTFS